MVFPDLYYYMEDGLDVRDCCNWRLHHPHHLHRAASSASWDQGKDLYLGGPSACGWHKKKDDISVVLLIGGCEFG